jgi:thiosulfate dehydrogenase
LQEKTMSESPAAASLGETVEHWRALGLRGRGPEDGLLRTGSNRFGTVAGNMVDVVQHSTQYLSNEDLLAVGTYLASLSPASPQRPSPAVAATVTSTVPAELYSTRGGLAYLQFCATCHRSDGNGVQDLFPPWRAIRPCKAMSLLADPHHAHRMACGTPCPAQGDEHAGVFRVERWRDCRDPQLRTGQLGWTSTGQYQRTKSPGCVPNWGRRSRDPKARFEAPRLADMLKEILLSSSVAPVSISRPAACCPSTWATD